MQYPNGKQAAVYLNLFLTLVVLACRAGFAPDVAFWTRWAAFMLEHGLGNAYQDASNNYPPLFNYFLFAYAKLASTPEKIVLNAHFIKVFVLPFDFAGALLAAWTFAPGNRDQRFTASLLLLANLAFVYNTVAWEQVDGLFSALVFGAVVLALRERAAWSAVLYVLALNAKTQAIIFLPPLLLLWAPLWWRTPRAGLAAAGSAVATQVLVLAPFAWGGDPNSLSRIGAVVAGGVDFYPYVSMNAHNWWQAAFEGGTSDAGRYAGLSYKHWGLLGFVAASAAALLPLARAAGRKLAQRRAFGPADYAPLLLSLGLLPVAFAYFNTQMHERYWHAALLFLASYGFLTGRYWLYGVFSLAYLLNLEAVLRYLGLKKYSVAVFSAPLGASLFTLVLVLGLVQLYRWARRTPDWPLLGPGRPPEVPSSTRPALAAG